MIKPTRKTERVFKTAWVSRAAKKAHIKDDELCEAIQHGDEGTSRRSCIQETPEQKYAMKTKTKSKYKSEAFEAIHSTAEGMYRSETIDKATMRHFDETCLVAPTELDPKQIKRLRESHYVSQPVFARYLNTSESTVEKWETGAKRPSGMALKLLSIVQKHGLKVLT